MYFVHPQINPAPFSILKSIGSLSSFKRCGVKLSESLYTYFPGKQLVFTDMGRSAFKIIIEKLNLQNSEILMPAYICDIFRPILEKYNIKPIFLDIDLKTFNIKPEEISRRISPKTKAILVSHTYGLPVDIQQVRQEAGQLLIIEDCAHSFGAQTGNLGDVAFFSIYKQFPTLRGGMLVCPPDWQIELPKTSFNFRDFISFLNCFSFFAFLFKKYGAKVAPKIVRKEKLSEAAGLNKFSLWLFSGFLCDFERSLGRRKELALFFQAELKKLGFEVQESENNVFCYLSALVPVRLKEKRDKIVERLRKYRVFCTRIWHTPVILSEEYPNTMEAARRIINFPLQNHYTEKDIKKMIVAIKKTVDQI